MKELSIEQKAKAYDEAIEKARIWKDKSGMPKDKQGILDDIFPELKESEDERIRKELIELLNDLWEEKQGLMTDRKDYEGYIAWLEKQANHANFRNKIEVGDKVTRNRDGVLVNLSQLNRVAKIDEKQGEQKPTNEEMKTLLQTEYEKGRADAIAEMQKSWNEEDENILTTIIEEGYLKLSERQWLKSLKDRVQQNQEWSEEDENRINRLIAYFEDKESFTAEDDVEYANWLKSLRPQWKPSNEQMKALWNVYQGDEEQTELATLYNDLKKLREK